MVERAAEAAEIEQAFGGPIEGHAHAVEQIDNRGSGLAHPLHRSLVREEIAAVDRVVKVLCGGIAFAFQILCSIDSALRAHGVRTLDRHNRK